MNKQKAIMILLFLPFLLFVLCLYGPFILMPFIDSSWYHSEEVDIGSFDYNSTLTKAEKAGYEVEGAWPWPGNFSGFKPGDVPELQKNFGSAVLVQDIKLNYNENSEIIVFVCEDKSKNWTRTCVAISNFSHSDPNSPLQISEFPDDFWTLEKLRLLFGSDEKAPEKYLESLKKAAQNQTWDAKIQVNESPDIPAVYAYLMENSDTSTHRSSLGILYSTTGSCMEKVFLKGGNRLGSVRCFIPEARIINYDKGNRYIGNRYIVELDASGKVRLEIIMHPGSSGESISEEEYRAFFKKMFKEMGLSPEAVDSFEFFHSSSRIW